MSKKREILAAPANPDLPFSSKVTIFVTDMQRVQEMNRAYKEFFPKDPPTRSCMEVGALPNPEALVEIEMIAHR